jgi:hypothetical protein
MTREEYNVEENTAVINEAASIIGRCMRGFRITLIDITVAEIEYINYAFNVLNGRIESLEAENKQLREKNQKLVEQINICLGRI